jgi:hypothetical protein
MMSVLAVFVVAAFVVFALVRIAHAVLLITTFLLVRAVILPNISLLARFLFLGLGVYRMHDDLKDLDVVLASADKDTLVEVVRQAESFLTAQLQSGIAADQRAITFASVIAAVIAILLGGYVTAAYSDHGAGSLGWIVLPAGFGLLASACIAAFTSRPTDWCYAGSNPRHWRDDVVAKKAHNIAVAEQAQLYAKGYRRE